MIESQVPVVLNHCQFPCRGDLNFYTGYLLGAEDYYSHMREDGFDFRDQEEPALDYKGSYSTEIFAQRAQEVIRDHSQSSKQVRTAAIHILLTPRRLLVLERSFSVAIQDFP